MFVLYPLWLTFGFVNLGFLKNARALCFTLCGSSKERKCSLVALPFSYGLVVFIGNLIASLVEIDHAYLLFFIRGLALP